MGASLTMYFLCEPALVGNGARFHCPNCGKVTRFGYPCRHCGYRRRAAPRSEYFLCEACPSCATVRSGKLEPYSAQSGSGRAFKSALHKGRARPPLRAGVRRRPVASIPAARAILPFRDSADSLLKSANCRAAFLGEDRGQCAAMPRVPGMVRAARAALAGLRALRSIPDTVFSKVGGG